MLIGVPKETHSSEHRVALIPESVGRLVKAGVTVHVERGAGLAAGFADSAYQAAGATLADAATVLAGADLVCKVQKPTAAEVAQLKPGAHLVSLLAPSPERLLLELRRIGPGRVVLAAGGPLTDDAGLERLLAELGRPVLIVR